MPIDSSLRSSDARRALLLVRERIANGSYPPGVWLPPERLLAEELAVNRATVRSVLALLEHEGLVAREAGRRPWVRPQAQGASNPAADAEAQTAVRAVAAILPQHPYYHASSLLLHGINRELRTTEAPFRLVVFDTHGDSTRTNVEYEERALRAIVDEPVAGVVIWHQGAERTLPLLERIQAAGTPVVYVDRHPTGVACDFVGVDNAAGAGDVVDYLLGLGHRRVAHLTTTERITSVLERRAGYDEALRSAGVLPRPEWVCAVDEGISPDVRPAVQRWFALPEPPTAVFAMNDALAHYFIAEAEQQGHRVPETMSVMGFDDLERYSPRPALLTSLHQPFDRIGRRAMQLLLTRLQPGASSAPASQHVLLPTPVVVRSTCRSLKKGGATS